MTSSRDRILNAAEVLMGERGLEVPLRDIAAEAGQRNNSAVHYHFGSREGLIEAVLERRTAPQEQRRLALLSELEDAGRSDDVPALVEVLVRPTCESPYADGATHFARFLMQVRNQPPISDAMFAPSRWAAGHLVANRITRSLDHLPARSRERRLESMMTVHFTLLADHERRWNGVGSPAPGPEAIDQIVAMLVGLLEAPERVTARAAG